MNRSGEGEGKGRSWQEAELMEWLYLVVSQVWYIVTHPMLDAQTELKNHRFSYPTREYNIRQEHEFAINTASQIVPPELKAFSYTYPFCSECYAAMQTHFF